MRAQRLGSGILALVVQGALALSAVAAAQPPGQRSLSPEERARLRAEQERRVEEDLATARPIAALDSVWIEELTWMEVRDALAAGKTTAIVATGGIEQNGLYLATGKHNVVLRGACERIARALGDALCAPIIKLVPEGSIDPPTGHMRYPGTLSLRQETFQMMLDDVTSGLRAHGFEHIVLIGDSGGNQRGMAAVAEAVNDRWGTKVAHYVPEFYRYEELIEWMGSDLGIVEPKNEGLHDDFATTAMMMAVDPESVRFEQRVAAGKASINGVALQPLEKTAEIGRKLLARRVEETVAAIRKARGS